MNYAKISKDIIDHLVAARQSLKDSPLSQSLRVLLELRVSQINACGYCCSLHSNEALKLGISNDVIKALPEFRNSPDFTDKEKEALAWSESLTKLDNNRKVKDTNLSLYFNEREIVDITICISIMNAFNRLAISMKDE